MIEPGRGGLFEGLNYAGAILALLAALGVLAWMLGLGTRFPYLLPLVLVVFVAGQFLMVVAATGLRRIRFDPKNVAALTGLYTLLSFWDLVSLVVGLPAIALTMVLGPLTVVVAVLAAVVLGLYLVEGVVGYDVAGYVSLLENPVQALAALVVLVAALAVLRWHLGQHESADWLLARAGDLAFRLRQRLQGAVARIMEK
ncbi:MAG: hypothetical protein P8129_10825 [Anaerolineae bacterium]